MFALVLSGVILVGLCAALVIYQRRRYPASKPVVRKTPPLVDRAFDPALCAFCDEAGKHGCPACSRRMCNDHVPWPATRFCWPCEEQWDRGARKRAIVIVPIVFAAMLGLAGVAGGLAAVTHADKLALGGVLLALAMAAPLYLRIERRMRRRFRPGTDLPAAKLR
jgi:hypothetical protein